MTNGLWLYWQVSKLRQGTDKNHAALQGLKSFLQAIMGMNDISSQGNNQITECICDYYSVSLRHVYDYIFQIFNVNPHTMKGDSFDNSFRLRLARDYAIKLSIYICLMFKCFVLHAKTEPSAIMHFDSQK